MAKINLPLDIKSLEIVSQSIDKKGNIVFEVRSKSRKTTCHKCGKPATKPNGRGPKRRVRHLPIFDQPVYLEIYPVRYTCEHCGDGTTTTEQYDWVSGNATITKGLEDYIMRNLIHSTIQDVSKRKGSGIRLFRRH